MNTLSYKNYTAKIELSPEDNCFVGKVLYIRDCIIFDGSSYEEIIKSFHDAIDGYLEDCKLNNFKPCIAFKGSFNVRIGQDLHRKAAEIASSQGVSLNEFIAHAVEDEIELVAKA
ncbi:MAG: type II toxin-antitoxin system HicB family antitoxin [Lentisphaerota bacterium]